MEFKMERQILIKKKKKIISYILFAFFDLHCSNSNTSIWRKSEL